jgi:hypothetical protein
MYGKIALVMLVLSANALSQSEGHWMGQWNGNASGTESPYNELPMQYVACYQSYCQTKDFWLIDNGCKFTEQYYLDYTFSEEKGGEKTNNGRCHPGDWVVGMKCTNSLCDTIQIRCGVGYDGCRAESEHNLRWWTQDFSNEGVSEDCGEGYFVRGFACKGAYCDNISLLCDRMATV